MKRTLFVLLALSLFGCSGGALTQPVTPATADASQQTSIQAVSPASTWSDVLRGYDNASTVYMRRTATDPCGYVPASAVPGHTLPKLPVGTAVTVAGTLETRSGAPVKAGACPWKIVNVTSMTAQKSTSQGSTPVTITIH